LWTCVVIKLETPTFFLRFGNMDEFLFRSSSVCWDSPYKYIGILKICMTFFEISKKNSWAVKRRDFERFFGRYMLIIRTVSYFMNIFYVSSLSHPLVEFDLFETPFIITRSKLARNLGQKRKFQVIRIFGQFSLNYL
jgi:hypothetical protein